MIPAPARFHQSRKRALCALAEPNHHSALCEPFLVFKRLAAGHLVNRLWFLCRGECHASPGLNFLANRGLEPRSLPAFMRNMNIVLGVFLLLSNKFAKHSLAVKS